MKQVLSSLPSRINYNKLTENYGKFADYVKCDTLREQLMKAYPGKLVAYTSIEQFCEKLTDILRSFNKLVFSGSFQDHKCIIVKYWMYEQLFKSIKSEYVITDMSRFLEILSNIWKDCITDKNCNIDDARTYSDEDFNKINDLFDYAQDYDTIERAINPTTKECSDEYMSYLKKGIQTYNEIKQDCSNNSHKPNCVQFSKLKSIYEMNSSSNNMYEMDNLSNKICEIENPSLKIALEVFDFPDDDDSEREEGKKKSLRMGAPEMEDEEGEEDEDVDKGAIGITGNGLDDPARMLLLEQNVRLEHGIPSDLQAQSHTLSPSPPSTNDNLRKSVIPVSGGLLSLFMFYKFTPLGRRLRVFFSRNKLNSLNNNQVNDYLLTNKIEYGHPNSEIDRHNIGYNPL
ncbi:PIR protein [Plasmodium vivax]|uniref:VIR protein n=1 Tax=Plasmodium vivax TaxID=5855 RepID=A0A565A3K1_PLAVI|nr:PIR protein [Plasmodium vivax]